jgi:ketosteroid isomerase-like protein
VAREVGGWEGDRVEDKRREGVGVVHPNVQRLTEFLDAYAAGNQEVIRDALAEEAVWHVGGTHRFSGDYRGQGDILDYFERVGAETAGTLRLDPIELLADDQRGAAFLRVTAERADQSLDVTMAEAFQFDDGGRIKEFWAHATDQDAVDRFWS